MSSIIGPSGLSGCYRCFFVWRPRTDEPVRCPRCKSALWDVPLLAKVRRGGGLGIAELLDPFRKEIAQALHETHARNPRVFGSVARGSAGRRSDVDLLVDFDPAASAFDQVGLAQDLEEVFGRHVEVTEPSGLHWIIRPQVLFEAVAI